jgi:hypothetical protein
MAVEWCCRKSELKAELEAERCLTARLRRLLHKYLDSENWLTEAGGQYTPDRHYWIGPIKEPWNPSEIENE